jgi:hypothetical protein
VDDAILRQYAAAIVDIKAVRMNVLTIWREEISMMLPEMSDSGSDGVTSQGASKHVDPNYYLLMVCSVNRGTSEGIIRADVSDLAHVDPDCDDFDKALL